MRPGVAQLRSLGNATTQLLQERATGHATRQAEGKPGSPMTGRELRAQLRAQHGRNTVLQQGSDAGAKVAAVANDGARYWWRVSYPAGRAFDFCALPEQNRQQVRDRYPGADVEPLPDDNTILAPALQPSTRPREAGPYTTTPLAERDPDDDRRTCTDCANLSPHKGRCLAAARGEGPGHAGREYHPKADLLRRCEWYMPKLSEADQRSGAERFPNLFPANRKHP